MSRKDARSQRCSPIQERLERLHEGRWRLPVREVTHPGEACQRRPLEEVRRLDPMGDGNHRVVLAPEDRDGRQRGQLVGAIKKNCRGVAPTR